MKTDGNGSFEVDEWIHSKLRKGVQSGRPNSLIPNGPPGIIRTRAPLIRSGVRSAASGYSSYDLLTLVTSCSRQRVDLFPPIQTSLPVVLSQVVSIEWGELLG